MRRPRRRPRTPGPRITATGLALALALALALTLVGRRGHSREDDPWLGRDKALHFSFSAALAGGGYGAAALVTEDPRWRLVAGAGLALTAGIGKELHDLSGRGDASARDLTWDAIGTATGLLVAWTIDHFLFQSARQGSAAP